MSARQKGLGQSLAIALVLAVAAVIIALPYAEVTYPAQTDAPAHGSQIAILRHYFDDSFGFRDQFVIQATSPALLLYAIGAALSFVFPIAWVTQWLGFTLLALLPIGLAVLFRGMKKSPLWGLLGLAFVWGRLSQFGFVFYLGGMGLTAMAIGLALLVVDRPTRGRRIGLAASLLGVFVTHVSHVPFAIVGVAVAGLLFYPATRRFRPLIIPASPAIALFIAWFLARPRAQRDSFEFELHAERLESFWTTPFSSFMGESGIEEAGVVHEMLGVLIVLATTSLILYIGQRRWVYARGHDLAWGAATTALPLALGAGCLVGYLIFPMRYGDWWYVFPRQATAALYFFLPVLPDLPRERWLRWPMVAAVLIVCARMSLFVSERWARFEDATQDFRSIAQRIPDSPRLLYLVFDHGDIEKRESPFVHLPTWIQTEKGGALSFHFAALGFYPARYRENASAVPPAVPVDWEWTPQRFRVLEHGPWFDTFLIRNRRGDPSSLLAADPDIEFVTREGSWYLYKRREPASDSE